MAIFDGAIFDSAIFDADAAAGAYSITITPGAITASGASITPTAARRVTVASASVTLTGANVTLKAARSVTVEAAAVTLSGADVAPTYGVASEPEEEQPQSFGGISTRADEDSLREWLDAVYEAKRAAKAPQEQAAEAIQSAKQSVALSEAPIDLSGVQKALQSLEAAIEQAETVVRIKQRRADLERAANIAVQAAQELRQKREEEDVLFLFLLAS